MAAERMGRLQALVQETKARLGDPGGRLGEILDLDTVQLEAQRGRMEGMSDPDAWREVAEGWSTVTQPYRALLARWREALVD